MSAEPPPSPLSETHYRLIVAALCQQVHPSLLDPILQDANLYVHANQPRLLELIDIAHCPRPYIKAVLKQAIRRIEAGKTSSDPTIKDAAAPDASLHEHLVEQYAMLQLPQPITPDSSSPASVIQYPVGDGRISIHEERDVIAANGGTGHRTWEAALALCNWVAQNANTIKPNVLELGAGTGLTGLVAAQLPQTQQVFLTDGDPQVVQQLQENIELNDMQTKCKAHKLYWEQDSMRDSVDGNWTILAADVTYDKEMIPPLLTSIKHHIAGKSTEVFISATIRSEETFAPFVTECERLGLKRELIERYDNHPFSIAMFYVAPSTSPIEIYRLRSLD